MEMIILRRPTQSERVPISAQYQAAEELPTIEVAQLSRKDELDMLRDDSVLGSAPSMPLILIEPIIRNVDSDSEFADAGSRLLWGIDAVGAHASAYSGEGVIVAILDTGIDKSHPAFKEVQLETENFTNEAPDDLHGHGTHCAGTFFGGDIDGVRIGIAPGVKRALVGKVLSRQGGATDAILKGVLWAYSKGATIISMSLGMDFPGYQKRLMEKQGLPVEIAASRAIAAYAANVRLFDRLSTFLTPTFGAPGGAILVAAAGNLAMKAAEKLDQIIVSQSRRQLLENAFYRLQLCSEARVFQTEIASTSRHSRIQGLLSPLLV